MAETARSTKRSKVGAVKAGAKGRSTAAAWVGRIMAGRPWSDGTGARVQLPCYPPRRPSKTASVELRGKVRIVCGGAAVADRPRRYLARASSAEEAMAGITTARG